MKMTTKLIAAWLPYLLIGLIATNIGEAIRMVQGVPASRWMLEFFAALPKAFENPTPSMVPQDLLIGLSCGGLLKLLMVMKQKNAKKYRHNEEYGSARWGTREDIRPFMDTVPENNIILTRTEGLMMSNRPKNPVYARNEA